MRFFARDARRGKQLNSIQAIERLEPRLVFSIASAAPVVLPPGAGLALPPGQVPPLPVPAVDSAVTPVVLPPGAGLALPPGQVPPLPVPAVDSAVTPVVLPPGAGLALPPGDSPPLPVPAVQGLPPTVFSMPPGAFTVPTPPPGVNTVLTQDLLLGGGYGSNIVYPFNALEGSSGSVTQAFTRPIDGLPGATDYYLDHGQSLPIAGNSPGYQLIIARYVGGQVDTTFGTDGAAILTGDVQSTLVEATTISQPDGSTLVVAFYHLGQINYIENEVMPGMDSPQGGAIVFYKLDPHGQLDPSFSQNGHVAAIVPGQFSSLGNVTVDANGGILVSIENRLAVLAQNVVPSHLVRFESNGTLDNSFGTNGRFDYLGLSTVSVQQLADGKILIAGDHLLVDGVKWTWQPGQIRLLANGQVDVPFTLGVIPDDLASTSASAVTVPDLQAAPVLPGAPAAAGTAPSVVQAAIAVSPTASPVVPATNLAPTTASVSDAETTSTGLVGSQPENTASNSAAPIDAPFVDFNTWASEL